MGNRMIRTGFGLSLYLVGGLLAPGVFAGPPLLCHPLEIGDAASLPMGGPGWREVRADHDLEKIPDETIALLGPSTPTLVRMETLRRATAYVLQDPAIAGVLLKKLESRAQGAEARGKSGALALFDYGYLIECYRQGEWIWKGGISLKGLKGYPFIRKALALRGEDPEMEFAAALVTGEGPSPDAKSLAAHRRKALAAAKEGSLLARNIRLHAGDLRLREGTLAVMRAEAAL